MPHMKPQIIGPTKWWMVETTSGTQWVQCEFVGRENIKAVDLLDHLRYAHSTKDIIRWEFQSGYGARLSAPGYLDCTPWDVFETEEDARNHLIDQYALCVICLGEMDGEICPECVKDLPTDKFVECLTSYVRDNVTVAELITLPGVYEVISELFNNDALDYAYQEMVVEYETKNQTSQGGEATQTPNKGEAHSSS